MPRPLRIAPALARWIVPALACACGPAAALAADAQASEARPGPSTTASEPRPVESEGEPRPAEGAAWTFELEPMIWAPAFNGEFRFPGGSSVDVQDINADESHLGPAGRLTINAGDWLLRFRGFAFNFDDSGRADASFRLAGGGVAEGDRIDTSIDYYGFDATIAYRLPPLVEDRDREVRLGFDLTGGARLHSLDARARSPGGPSSSGENTWVEPIVGLRMAIDLPHALSIEVTADAGGLPLGDTSSWSADITASFRWRFIDNAGIEIGFRVLRADLADGKGADEFEFNGSLAGLFGALVIRF